MILAEIALMSNRRIVMTVFIFLTLASSVPEASIPERQNINIQLRAGQHQEFLRLVFESPSDTVISGKVSRDQKGIRVTFPHSVAVRAALLPIPFASRNNEVFFPLQYSGGIRSFSLREPNRFVLDLQEFTEEHKGVNQKSAAGEAKKEDAPIQKPDDAAREAGPQSSAIDGSKEKDPVLHAPDKEMEVPERYRQVRALLDSGNAFGVLTVLPEYKPLSSEEIAIYHYLYGRAYAMAQRYQDSIEHLRLAYVHASDKALKEEALFLRAEVYREQGLIYEAQSNYHLFIDEYPQSRHREQAELGFANCLSETGSFADAVTHYQKAGDTAEVIFNMANALQRTEKIEKAREMYARGLRLDRNYAITSPETRYLMGENYRLAGDPEKAKELLSMIESGMYSNKAKISLGLIAMQESNIELARSTFQLAARSSDDSVKVRALFNLAFAYMTEGKKKEAIETLEEVRHNYYDYALYRDTLLALARLYKEDGKYHQSVAMLKELVYGITPPAEAFEELEEIIIKASTGATSEDEKIDFAKLWMEAGEWLVDQSREEFLLNVVERLRFEGKPFIQLAEWLVENASQTGRMKAASGLADYYISIGNVTLAERYITYTIGPENPDDQTMRVRARIRKEKGEYAQALQDIMKIRKIQEGDLLVLANVISDAGDSGGATVQQAIDYLAEKVDGGDWSAELYMKLADILYVHNDKQRSLRYIQAAYRKNPDNEWALYRIGRNIGKPESEKMFARLKNGDSLLGRLAKSKLMEISLINRVEEVY